MTRKSGERWSHVVDATKWELTTARGFAIPTPMGNYNGVVAPPRSPAWAFAVFSRPTMREYDTKKLLGVLLLELLLVSSTFAFSRPTHEWQIHEVFSEVEGSSFHQAVNSISWAMDNGLLISFKTKIGRVPGNLGDHRIIGHGWSLGGRIPRHTLDVLTEHNPGKNGEIMDWWRGESRRLVDEMAQATGLPKKQAQA